MKLAEEKEDLGHGVILEMVLIPAGKFMMGSLESKKGRYDNETQHEVTLTKPFYLGIYTVTQEQWEAVMGNNPSGTPVNQLLPRNVTLWDALFCGIRIYNQGANFPVNYVSWEDCHKFIKKLNEKTDGGYRLPSEAEWEYACRAGTTTAYSWGDKITLKDANYSDCSNTDKLVAVGSYKSNGFGLFDMHGNVFEYCEDWFGGYPKDSVTDPKGATTGDHRVQRGGSFCSYVSAARSSVRGLVTPTFWYLNNGFRLVRTS